jgi:succinate dehydrogenase / fumarate reductase membrane anchor subunit
MQNTLSDTKATGQRAGALWLLQVISGALLILVLGLHMIAHHFVVEGGLREFADVVAYISNPLVFLIELVFLIVVSIHAMLGVRAVLYDLGPKESTARAIDWLLILVGVGIVVYGIWLAVTLQGMVG